MADYNQTLKQIDATSRTVGALGRNVRAKNIVGIWWGLVVLVLLTVFTLWLVKKYLKNEAGNLWDFVSKPYRDLVAELRALEAVEQTGTAPTLGGVDDATEVADRIYACFQPLHDDEQTLYALLRGRIANAADWSLVKGRFGVRDCPKVGLMVGIKHTGDLEHVIADNLSPKERATVRQILNSKGIETTI